MLSTGLIVLGALAVLIIRESMQVDYLPSRCHPNPPSFVLIHVRCATAKI
jgi:hypothetical protein